MSLDTSQTDQAPLTRPAQLVETFRAAERPDGALLVGLEHEKLMFPRRGFAPVNYEGQAGIGKLLDGFAHKGFKEFRETPESPVIAMTRGQETISLEPGGQVELSGRPWATAREAHQENLQHLTDLREVASGLGLRTVALGYRPFTALELMPWMPKTRYRVMRQTLGTRGALARNMMLMTATGQVSLDWRSEEDCAKKVTASARISPLLVALYANSPLADGQPTGYLSYRSKVWNEVDPARCGYPRAMLDGTFSYQAYVDWALDAPMLFLRRRGQYLDPRCTFRTLMAQGWEGQPPTLADWTDHLSTLFPEVRIKKVLEIRAADCNGPALTGALAALMRGLLYDPAALDEVSSLLPPMSHDEHLALHHAAQQLGLKARVRTGTLGDYAKDLVAIAQRGLGRLDPLDVHLLGPLAEVAELGRSGAHEVVEHFERERRPGVFLERYEI
jgi:glutamate--cysteine ligase